MSKKEPSSLGHRPRELAEHSTGRIGVLGRMAAALDVLSCLDTAPGEVVGDLGPPRDPSEIARLTGLPRGVVYEQLARLVQLGYVDEIARQRYQLSTAALGRIEIVATSARHSWTEPHKRTPGEDDPTGPPT